jgi:alpha-glucosidase
MTHMSDFVWWRDGVIYQIYPRSFADNNNDGLGDLTGIIDRLDYLADLGIDAIWLSPFYPTPDRDFGYDISDYTDVDPRFGTLEDLDRLVRSAHQRGIRIVLDLVLNHTSDQHAWFKESLASRDNPRADWYIWRDAPNNWQSVFGGRAWTYVRERGQYFYHMFLPEQPDVNWRNPAVREALLGVVKFWLDRGVDGFRLDVFNVYFKSADFRDNPGKPGLRGFDRQQHLHDFDQPEMIPLLHDLRSLLDSYPERYAVGETFYSTPEKIKRYCRPDGLHAAFNFEFTHAPFQPARYIKAIRDWQQIEMDEGIWPIYVLGNHDVRRMATRHA